MLRDPHAVAGDHRLALHVNPRNPFQLLARQTAGREDVVPGGLSEIGSECFETVGVIGDKDRVEHRRLAGAPRGDVRLEHQLHDALERGGIAADPDLAVFAGDTGRSETRHLDRILRRSEPLQGPFLQRVEDDDRDVPHAAEDAAEGYELCNSVIIRGLLVPGFWPRMKIASACSKSSSTTVPLPIPIDSGRPTLVGS